MKTFIILKPEELYTFDDGVGSFSIYDGTPPAPKGDLSPGMHFLQIEVATWSYFADSKRFHQKWKDKGVLWTEGVTSMPMPFTIEKNHLITKCPEASLK